MSDEPEPYSSPDDFDWQAFAAAVEAELWEAQKLSERKKENDRIFSGNFGEVRRSAKDQVWYELGGYTPKLEPLVEQYLNGATVEKRLEAFEKLDAYRAKRSEGAAINASVAARDDPDYDPDPARKRVMFRSAGPRPRPGRPVNAAANDREAARAFIEAAAKRRGRTVAELASAGRGEPYSVAAQVAFEAWGTFTQAAIRDVLGGSAGRISTLVRRGRELAAGT